MNIRQMEISDLDFAVFCTEAEGWDSEVRDVFESFISFFPSGCLIAEKDGVSAGMVIATPYRYHGFIGELIVLPGYRGQGIGTALFREAVEMLSRRGMKTILLDGDLKAVPIYERGGFRKVCRSLRFEGSLEGTIHGTVRSMSWQDMMIIKDQERDLFGDDRSFFLENILEQYPEYCLVDKVDGRIKGYLFARKGRGLIVVGPWAVFQGGDREAMLETLSFRVSELPLRIGVLESNKEASCFLRSLKDFHEQEFSWRMEWGCPSKLGEHGDLFAIGSPARG